MLQKIIIFLSLPILFACKEQTNNIGIEKLPHTKYLLDSTLQVLQAFAITKDTFYGSEDMYNRKSIDVTIQSIDSTKNRLALISIQETDTSNFRVFIFEVTQPKWKFLSSIDNLGSNQFINYIELVDVDFDNKKDLLTSSFCLASRIVSRYDCFEFDGVNFTIGHQKIAELYSSGKYSSLLGFDMDTVKKTITCYTDGGFMGTEEQRVYRWNQDTLQLFKQLDMVYMDTFFIYHKYFYAKNKIDLTDEEDLEEGDTIGYQICLNEYELVKGVMKLTKQQRTFQEDADSYFQRWK